MDAVDGFTIALFGLVFSRARLSSLAGGGHVSHPIAAIALQEPGHIERDGVPDLNHMTMTWEGLA